MEISWQFQSEKWLPVYFTEKIQRCKHALYDFGSSNLWVFEFRERHNQGVHFYFHDVPILKSGVLKICKGA